MPTTFVKLLDANTKLVPNFERVLGISGSVNAAYPSELIDILSGCWSRLLTTIKMYIPPWGHI